MKNASNVGHIPSFVRLPNISSRLYSSSCTQLKNCHLGLCSMFKTIFPFTFFGDDRRITMLLAPGHNHAVFFIQSSEPSAICTLWETTERTRERSFALIVVVKHCDKFVITGKSVLHFKSNGKVKSKWLIGRRL